MRKIMIIVAHPDDAELYAYGIISKLLATGQEVYTLILTTGEAGNGVDRNNTIIIRKTEASNVATLLGYKYEFGNFKDGEILPTIENREYLIRKIRSVRPDIIITHRDNDYHPDHRYLSTLVKDSLIGLCSQAVCPEIKALDYTPIVLFFWNRFTHPSKFKIELVIRIDDCIEDKIKCLLKYESQFENEDSIRELVEEEAKEIATTYQDELNKRYKENIEYAEALELCEYARIMDLKEFQKCEDEIFCF